MGKRLFNDLALRLVDGHPARNEIFNEPAEAFVRIRGEVNGNCVVVLQKQTPGHAKRCVQYDSSSGGASVSFLTERFLAVVAAQGRAAVL